MQEDSGPLDELGTGRTAQGRPGGSAWYGSETGHDSIEISGDRVFMCRNGMAMFSGHLFNETAHSASIIATVAAEKWTPLTGFFCHKLNFADVGPLGSGSLAAAEANRIHSSHFNHPDFGVPVTEQQGEDAIRRMLWRGL